MNRSIAVAACTVLGLSSVAGRAQATHTGGPVADDSQTATCNGSPLAGIVRDTTGATVAEAAITLDGGSTTQTGKDGRFQLRCVMDGTHKLHIAATSFAPLDMPVSSARSRTELAITLTPESVEQTVSVNAGAARGVDNTETGVSRTLAGDDLKALADDPDDLLRQLQQLSAGAGGNPSDALITVDGFQGVSRLPPKSSIAYIKVNPDLFSAEYQEPPYTGGRVEVYTKPGQSRYHGSLFMTYGGSALNASDPFAVTKGKIGKQRYGFELSGPVRSQGSDFALSLEHRSIDNITAVNAVTLDSSGNAASLLQTVPTPESFWNGSARLAWQLGPKNTFTSSYTATDNIVHNRGVGGTSLAETGYDQHSYDHTLRFINITTASANLMHEARLSLRWIGEISTPHSTAPQVQVAGAFTGGGATVGQLQVRDTPAIEIADDAIWTHGAHTIKVGINLRVFRERQQLSKNFNGSYIFGGGMAPVLDASGNATAASGIITGLEQYRRAQLHLGGGTPTAYTAVTGSPEVNFTQTRGAIFAEDEWKLRPNLKVSLGARYYAQNDPETWLNLVPRAGIAWSPDKAQKWTLKVHAGMFSGQYRTDDWAEIRRLDGVQRVSSIVYSPIYGNPFLNATPVRTVRTTAPGFSNVTFGEEQFELDHSLPHGWNVQGTVYNFRGWNFARTVNSNAPLNGQPNGPRPGPANLNVLQLQNSASMKGDIEFFSVDQHTLKWLNIFVGYARVDLKSDTDNDTFSSPQSSFTDAGEYARRSGQDQHQIFGSGTLHLPAKVDFSPNYYVGSGQAFNLTTGFDNNGDGNFNDRPTYAKAGDPNALATQYGRLVASGGSGVVPRNTGTMPFHVFLDGNLSRTFTLTPHAAQDHAQSLAVNLRSANLLNHTNVSQVGGVLGSPLFGRAYQANSGRRVEFGLHYNF